MTLLVLSSVYICHKADQLIDCDIVHSTLEMDLQILSLVAEELPIGNNDANFPW